MVWRWQTAAAVIPGVLLGMGIGFLIGRSASPTRDPASAEVYAGRPPSVLTLQRPVGDSASDNARAKPAQKTTFSAEFLADFPQPSRQDLEAFLESRGRDAESLVTAYLSGWKDDHLIEAARQYPDDPLVQWTVLSLGFHEEMLGDEAADWAERFKASEPENPMAYYFSALAKLDRDPEAALSELEDATGVRGGTDFDAQEWVTKCALFESMGEPSWKAEAYAMVIRSTPELQGLRKLATGIAAWAEEKRDAGDAEAADRAASALLEMGRQIEEDPMMPERLVGMAIRAKAVAALDPEQSYPFIDGSVDDYQSSLYEERVALRSVAEYYNELHGEIRGLEQTMAFGERDWREFLRRVRVQGEISAHEWLRSRAEK